MEYSVTDDRQGTCEFRGGVEARPNGNLLTFRVKMRKRPCPWIWGKEKRYG